jgi:hypothetical protein
MAAASRYPSCSGSSSLRSPQMIRVGAVIVPDSEGGTAVVSPARPAIHTCAGTRRPSRIRSLMYQSGTW